MSQHTCPHCGTTNQEPGNVPKKIVEAFLPPLTAALLVKAAGATNKLAGVVASGVVLATSVKHYYDGKKITCGNCDKDYSA